MAFASTDKERERLYSFVAFVKDPASKKELEHLFKIASVSNTYVAIGDITATINWLRKVEYSPQRILVDISDAARPLDELDRLADACEPSVQVYVTGERNDVGLYRSLLKKGVSDYIVKPLNIDLMRRTFFSSDQGPRRARHGKCVVLTGTRGGVGVTSIAAHLSRALVSGGAHRRVVYVDLNIYDGNGAGLLGHPGGRGLIDLLTNTDRLDQQFVDRALSDAGEGLFVLNAELEYPEEFNPYEGALTTLLNTLGQYFHYVVVDLPAKTGMLATEALEQAGIVCTITDNSVHSARVLTRLVRYVASLAIPPVIIPILNHVRPITSNQVKEKDFTEATEITLHQTIGFDPKGPVLAENLGQALPRTSDFGRNIEQLAKLVTGEASALETQSWWQRLIRR